MVGGIRSLDYRSSSANPTSANHRVYAVYLNKKKNPTKDAQD